MKYSFKSGYPDLESGTIEMYTVDGKVCFQTSTKNSSKGLFKKPSHQQHFIDYEELHKLIVALVDMKIEIEDNHKRSVLMK